MSGKTMKQMFEELGFGVIVMDGPRPPGIPSHDAIVASEAAGQKKLVNSTRLPFQTNGQGHQPFLDVGITLGDKVVDELFVEAELPEGWTKRAAPDHNMWSYVYDQHGRKRIGLFYKAAVYDRRAHMKLEPRFSTDQVHQIEGNWQSPSRLVVTDANTTEPPFATDWIPDGDYDGVNAARTKCETWLDEHRPDWKNPAAYWEETP